MHVSPGAREKWSKEGSLVVIDSHGSWVLSLWDTGGCHVYICIAFPSRSFLGELGGMPLVVQFVPKTLCLSNRASLVSVALAKNNEPAVCAGTKQDSKEEEEEEEKRMSIPSMITADCEFLVCIQVSYIRNGNALQCIIRIKSSWASVLSLCLVRFCCLEEAFTARINQDEAVLSPCLLFLHDTEVMTHEQHQINPGDTRKSSLS